MGYGSALKQRVLALYDQGLKTKEVAERLLISRSGARRVKQRRNEPPRKVGGGHFKLDEQACRTLGGWIEQTPDATLEELRQRIAAELKIAVSVGALWNTLRRLKLSLKKSRSRPASRSGRTFVPRVRRSSGSSKTSR
jgi:transposase